MNARLLTLAILLSSGLLFAAEPQTLYFGKESAREYTRIVLTIEGDQVTGTQIWQPEEQHGAHGILKGTISPGGLIRAVYEYTIEGSEQSEEEVLKLSGNSLFIGEGELVEGPNGLMKLKDAANITFKTELKKVPVSEPRPGTPERKAVMDAMRAPVSAHVGQAVTFTGSIKTSGSWASFSGNVTTSDGRPPQNADAATDLELDFMALLSKDSKGVWKVLHWGFAGDISVGEAAREKFPKAPWVLFE